MIRSSMSFRGLLGACALALVPALASAKVDAPKIFTEPQILGVVFTTNNAEISSGQLALKQARAVEVKDLAQKLISDHTNSNAQLQALASRLRIKVEESPASLKMKSEADLKQENLQSLKGEKFDITFLHVQIAMHKEALNAIDDELLPAAQNSELKSLLTQTRATVAMHLQMAQKLLCSMK